MTYRKKLIEVALPLDTINLESSREKSIRHGHPNTLHLWWARRPLAAARAVLWSSIVDDPSAHPDRFPTAEDQLTERKRLFDMLERLVRWEATTDEGVLDEARRELLSSCNGVLPTILDPFGGGGTIPLEALRLGLPTVTGDLNPVAVLVQLGMLDVPQRFAGRRPVAPAADQALNWSGLQGLVADIEHYGQRLGDEVQQQVGEHYPRPVDDAGKRHAPIAWFWARAVRSPDPSWQGEVPLVGSWVIVSKPGKPKIWVEPQVVGNKVHYRIREGGSPPPGTIGRGRGTCLATGTAISNDYIKAEGQAGRLTQHLIAVAVTAPRGRRYLSPTDADIAATAVDASTAWRPTGAMSTHSQ